MSWPTTNQPPLLDLDDSPSSSSFRQQQQQQTSRPPLSRPHSQNDPFAERPSISYDDFAGQAPSFTNPYTGPSSASNISLGTPGTTPGLYTQPSPYFDDAYNDDHGLMDTQRSRRS